MSHTAVVANARQIEPRSVNRRQILLEIAKVCAGVPLAAAIAGCHNRTDDASSGGAQNMFRGKRVGISSPHQVEILNELYVDMKREAAKSAAGLEVVVVDANNDAIKQLNDIESFIAQEYDGIFFLALPSPGLEQLVAQATAQGIFMFSHGASPVSGATQNVVLDQHFSGAQIGEFAGRWINENCGGNADVGVLGNSNDPWLQIRTQGLKDGLLKAAPNAKIVGEVHGHSIELGTSGAANLLKAHPDIRVLLAHADDPGFGCYTAATEAGKSDPRRFCVASCDGTRLVMDKVAEGGIYQATWSYLFPFSATAFMRDMIRCLHGEKVAPTRTQVGRLVTHENCADIGAIIRDPQAPDVQKLYSDPSVMRYSDAALESPRS